MPFITRIGTVTVENAEVVRPGGKPYLPVAPSGIGVLHTTEGGNLSGALSTFKQNGDPPHFLVGENRILQCRPLGVRAAALRSNNGDTANRNAQVQIEMVGFSREQVWKPASPTFDMAALVMAYCAKHFGIPLQRPDQSWLDDNSDMPKPWAANNKRRQQAAAGLWPAAKGWWMHVEVPFQAPTWHWDCGALDRHDLLTAAQQLVANGGV